MAQSLNTQVFLHTTGAAYTGIGSKVGKFLIGDKAIEFYPDSNVEQFIQIPWGSMVHVGAAVSDKRISRHFEILTPQGNFAFTSKDSGKILKIARQELGNDKVVKLPTLVQTIAAKLQALFAKKS